MTSQEVALREATEGTVAQLRDDAFVQEVQLAVPEGVSHLQLLRVAQTAVLENPALAKPALRKSLLQATLKAAADGLFPNGREAAFVIYEGKDPRVQYQPMIFGVRRLAAEYGWDIRTGVVYENDPVFEDRSDEGIIIHRKARLGDDRGALIGAWAMGVHRDGKRRKALVYDKKRIEKVRAVSKAPNGPGWKNWYDEMAEKTVGHRLFKLLPLDPNERRLAMAIEALDAGEDSAAELLYGPAGQVAQVIEHRPAGELISSPPDGDADTAAGEGDADGKRRSGANSPAATSSDEPSDAELEALGQDDEPVEGEVVDEEAWRFPNGKFEGQTVREAYESGGRGRGYVAWAAGHGKDDGWKNEDERQIIADEYETLKAEES